jgi:hypothetical protein
MRCLEPMRPALSASSFETRASALLGMRVKSGLP